MLDGAKHGGGGVMTTLAPPLAAETAPSAQPATGWDRRYAELSDLMYAVRRARRTLPVLGLSMAHPRHAIPPVQLQLLRDLEALTGARSPLPSLGTVTRWWIKCVWWALRDTVRL